MLHGKRTLIPEDVLLPEKLVGFKVNLPTSSWQRQRELRVWFLATVVRVGDSEEVSWGTENYC